MARGRVGVCNEPGCPNFTMGTAKCDDCRQANEAARGSRHQRGYGNEHTKGRKALLAQKPTHCATCDQPFTADNPMTAGHVVAQRHGGTSADGYKPECVICNYGWRRTGS